MPVNDHRGAIIYIGADVTGAGLVRRPATGWRWGPPLLTASGGCWRRAGTFPPRPRCAGSRVAFGRFRIDCPEAEQQPNTQPARVADPRGPHAGAWETPSRTHVRPEPVPRGVDSHRRRVRLLATSSGRTPRVTIHGTRCRPQGGIHSRTAIREIGLATSGRIVSGGSS
jgi:hypothetical protein